MEKRVFVLRVLAGLCLVLTPLLANADLGCEQALESPEARARTLNAISFQLKPLAESQPVRLRFATWNVNLLDRRVRFARVPLGRITTPHYNERSRRLPEVLSEWLASADAPDVLMLQEVWTKADQESVARLAGQFGYRVAEANSARGLIHGLQILVRGAEVIEAGFAPLKIKRSVIESFGGVQRGLLWVKLRLDDGQSVFAGNVHFTPFVRYHGLRLAQIESAKKTVEALSADADHVLVGGDLNIASDFRSPRPQEVARLQTGKYLYAHFAQTTGMRDAFRSVEDERPGFTFNPRFRPRGWLHFEADQRLDYIWLAEKSAGSYQHVVDADVTFTDPDSEGLYLSDHYMVRATIDFFRVRRELH